MAKSNLKLSARSVAAQIIAEVAQQHHSLTSLLHQQLPQLPERERGLCQQLCYGVLRWYPLLRVISEKLLNKPLKNKDADITALLLCGLYQLRDMRIPPHAALSETVNGCQQLNKLWAKGLLNACLRNYQREQAAIEQQLSDDEVTKSAHPAWLLALFKQDWPQHWQQIVGANNQQPPMILRVNRQFHSRDDYLHLLTEQAISAEALTACQDGIVLKTACDVHALPGFDQGWVSVQDGAAQQVVDLLSIQPGLRVLDACAAPGGKSCHILERDPDCHLVAIDIAPDRLQQIQDNLDRLHFQAELIAADASDTESWWDGQLFDRILIDAPCSGTGVIRRHPDIKLLRRKEDIATLAKRQQQLMTQLWQLLKPGGLMVYTTCSVLKRENEQQVEDFIRQHADASEYRPDSIPVRITTYGYQRLPGDDVMDGFYYACLRRN